MRTFLTVFVMLLFVSAAFAKASGNVSGNLPSGVFKKNYHGQFVQYDSKGKKIGVYEVKAGKLVKIR